jgi:hypothetical protein
MFYHSLVLVLFLTLSSQIPAAMKSGWSFGPMYSVWAFLWAFVLFWWHLIISKPPAVMTVFLSMFIALALARAIKLRSRWFALWSACCVVLAYCISILNFIPVYHEHQRILAQHPPVDLKPRLAYERPSQLVTDHDSQINVSDKTTPAIGATVAADTPQFDSNVLQDQSRVFNSSFGYYEHQQLQTLEALNSIHEGFVEDFIEQPALGVVGRLPALRSLRESDAVAAEEIRERIPSVPIDQPSSPISEVELASRNAENRGGGNDAPPVPGEKPEPAAKPAPTRESLQEFHLGSVVGFAPQESFGSVDERRTVRGFRPHAFNHLPSLYSGNAKPEEWKMTRLELVSLLKHQPPAAYVSEHLPAMDELRDAPTRPTTKFEEDAISELRDGEELVVETTGQTARMVGSIRAIAECRKCHQVPLGGLLGAFSYRLILGNGSKPQRPKTTKGEARFNRTLEIPIANGQSTRLFVADLARD